MDRACSHKARTPSGRCPNCRAQARFEADPTVREKRRAYGREYNKTRREYLRNWKRNDPNKKRNNYRPSQRFGAFKNRAQRKGIRFELTLVQWSELVLGARCSYCQGDLPLSGCALDRVDNSRGYVIGNVVPCCNTCNRIKSDLLSSSEMVQVAALLKYLRSQAA